MKIYISVDMEGITGVVDWSETERPNADYERFRRIMTDEVNAAVAGAVEGGAEEALVNDSHDTMRNVLIEHLHERARLLSGCHKRLSMMEGIDASFAGVFMIGYHAPAGTRRSVLDHTYSSRTHRVWVNGIETPEFALFGAVAGVFGVPVKLVTGDEETCRQARDYFGEIETVAVKQAVSRRAAISKPVKVAHEEIREAARRAVSCPGKVVGFPPPIQLRVEFQSTRETDQAEVVPLSKRLDAYTLEYTHEDYLVVMDAFRAMNHLASM